MSCQYAFPDILDTTCDDDGGDVRLIFGAKKKFEHLGVHGNFGSDSVASFRETTHGAFVQERRLAKRLVSGSFCLEQRFQGVVRTACFATKVLPEHHARVLRSERLVRVEQQ
jgi:hypothetical protein